MSFSEILRDAVQNVDGAISASLVGVDGIVVETVQGERVDQLVPVGAASTNGHSRTTSVNSTSGTADDAVEVEVASLVASVTRTAAATAAGGIREIIVDAERMSFLIATIDQNYFLVVAAEPLANLGRARYELRRAAQKISSQF